MSVSLLQHLKEATAKLWRIVGRRQPDILIGLEVRESTWEDWLDSGGELYTKREANSPRRAKRINIEGGKPLP